VLNICGGYKESDARSSNLGCISAVSRLHLGCISAASRQVKLHLEAKLGETAEGRDRL